MNKIPHLSDRFRFLQENQSYVRMNYFWYTITKSLSWRKTEEKARMEKFDEAVS